jgi:hypothetical protein
MLALTDESLARLLIAATAIAPAEREAWLMRFAERAEQPKTCSRETQVSCAAPSGSGAFADKLVRRPVWLEGPRGLVRASCPRCAAAATALHAGFADAR